MARPKNRTAPKYRHHKPSGKASVVINGKYHYLGKYNSSESRHVSIGTCLQRSGWLSNSISFRLTDRL